MEEINLYPKERAVFQETGKVSKRFTVELIRIPKA